MIDGDWGNVPNKQNRLGNWLEQAKTEPFSFCDSTGPRLLLGRTRKRNVPKTLEYQGFVDRTSSEKEVVNDFIRWITFRYNNEIEHKRGHNFGLAVVIAESHSCFCIAPEICRTPVGMQ